MAKTAAVIDVPVQEEDESTVWEMAEADIDEGLADVKVPTNPAVDIQSIIAALDLGSIIKQQVAEQVEEATRVAALNQSNQIVDATQRGQKSVTPERYLKHYRCDVSPDITIQVRLYDADEDKLGAVVKGQRIQFRRGHFFAKEQREVDQIEWMIRHPSLDPTDSSRVIGGNPTIYEDDGKDLVKCAYCDEVFVAQSNSLKSHLRATHGVDV